MKNQELINFLNQLLSNYFILYVKLHRYHWYIKGRHFFQLHEHFEELYLKTQDELDEIAERIIMIGGQPLATMSMYLKQGTLEEANADDTEKEMISQLIHDFNRITKEIIDTGLPLTDEFADEPTNDILIGHQKRFETEIWMLKSYQKEN
ncbi:Dps family protein [Oceanobacillus sp. FSL H7-0719]|uniref:Dps family protein n=1 Tax=Oceanobacillus sp. FSL H7-0719 TaxID=2954507 RepID=UPI0032534E59